MKPPTEIDGARLVCWSAIDSRHRPTERSGQIVAGEVVRQAQGLAIGRRAGEEVHHLFACDAGWKKLSDTRHATLADALSEAELQYEGVSETWTFVG